MELQMNIFDQPVDPQSKMDQFMALIRDPLRSPVKPETAPKVSWGRSAPDSKPSQKIHGLGDKLRVLADKMENQIDQKLNSAIRDQNPTPRRARIIESMEVEGQKLKKIQRALYALADHHDNGTINPMLAGIRSKKAVETLFNFSQYPQDPHGWWKNEKKSIDKAGITSENYETVKAMVVAMGDDGVREHPTKKRLRDLEYDVRFSKIPGYFPTPQGVLDVISQYLPAEREGMWILEPSAGSGNIAEFLREKYPSADRLWCFETYSTLCEILKLKGFTVFQGDFMDRLMHEGCKNYDLIVMNPPFENGQDVDHILQGLSLLAPHGRLISVASASVEFRKDRKYTEFRETIENLGGMIIPLPEGSFKPSGTGVNTVLVVVDF